MMQNYLNMSFKASERAANSPHDDEDDEEEEERKSRSLSQDKSISKQAQPRSNPPLQQSVNHLNPRSNSASRLNHNTSAMSAAADPRKNDTLHACLSIKRVEFFCTKVNLIKHSHYLMRVFEKQERSGDPKERAAQVRIKLPESTKADVLLMFLDYIDKGKELPNKIDLYIAQNVLLIAEALKMRAI